MSDTVITVRGEHETSVPPDRAVAHLTVRTEGPERGPVVERIAALTAPVRDDLVARAQAGTVHDWSSARVSVWSSRPWHPDGKRLRPVHYASVDITATFTDATALSWWIGEVIEREGVQVGYIDWQLAPEVRARVEREVAAEAVRIAVERARAYAAAIGLQTVEPLEIADIGLLGRPGDGGPPSLRGMGAAPLMARAAADAGPPPLEFEPEDIRVSAGVEARFAARP